MAAKNTPSWFDEPIILVGDVVFYFDDKLPRLFPVLDTLGASVPFCRAVVRRVYTLERGVIDLQLGFDNKTREATGEVKQRVPRQSIALGQKSGTWQPIA